MYVQALVHRWKYFYLLYIVIGSLYQIVNNRKYTKKIVNLNYFISQMKFFGLDFCLLKKKRGENVELHRHKNVQGLAWEFHQIDLFVISHDFTSFLAFCVRKRKLNEKRTKREKTWISLEWHKKGPRFSMRIEEGHGIYIEMYLLTKLAKKKLVSVYL